MKVRCEAQNVYQDKSTGNVSYGPWLPCSSPAIGGYINVRTTNEKPISSHDYSGIGLGQVGGDRYRISNPFNTKPDEFSVYSPLYKPQIQPYVRPEFVPYTPPVKSFLEEPRYIPPVIVTISSTTLSKLKEFRNEAQKLKDSAITPSDHIRADIAMNEAWRIDTECYREIAIKNNDHGTYGIEFRDKQLETHSSITLTKLEELRNEAQKLKDSAITPSDHMRADIAMNEAWRTDTEWHRTIAIKTNNHGEYGIEFRDKQLEMQSSITLTKLKELRNEAQKLKDSAITPSDHMRADIAMNEAWRTDTEWHRSIAIKTNNHGTYGIEFRNNQLETHNNITFSKIKDFTQNNVYINLSGLNINDNVAKLLADSLAKGEMPNLKTLRLEGNKITNEGETALVKAMKGKAQDIIILTQRVDITKKMISGTKEEKIAIYKDLIEKGKAKGTYDEALVIDKSLWGEIKNSGKILKVVTNASIGFTKCHFAPEDIAVDYAQNKIMAILPKMINGVLNYAAKLVDLENIFTCYVDASEDAWTSAVGQQAVKHELCVVGETEFCGE